MINLNLLEEVVADQIKNFRKKDIGVLRDIEFEKHLKTKQITVILGVRRSGKSTLLRQFAEKFENFYYINFDDERLLNFTIEDFQNLMIVFYKLYPSGVFFLDEVQNIEKWERFVRRIYEEGLKIFLTGSNARLLSSEIGTHLTGRYFKIELYPFSFKEFLAYKKIDYKKKDSQHKATILKRFDEYLESGGFPEFIKYQDNEYLKRIYEDILYKDLLTRFKIREVKVFRELASFLFTNVTKEISYNSLKNTLGFKSVMSVKNYIEFMRESFLVFELYKYDYSLKKQFVSDKKIYVIDNGLRNSVSFYFLKDSGRLLENMVFLELKRQGMEVYFFKDKKECDFIIKEKGIIITAMQVCFELNSENMEREVNGLKEAMKKFNLKHGLILTKNQENIIKTDELIMEVTPVWKWLLESSGR